ncbi:MAG: alpha-amylase, partial [Candidatus Eisenbacteria sp.]|nr:alpha-amylase [Candidatus Eisenbacteria bacterium]
MLRILRLGRASIMLTVCITLLSLLVFSCEPKQTTPAKTAQPKVTSQVVHPLWSHNAGIYEVNVRQYSPGGTFAEFEKHLPRLKEMGIGILWFMPVHPIGEAKRKGTLGSYYSIKDYYAVNPEFGTLEEFTSLVSKIHEMGMHVIIDWVPNHSAWDNPLTMEHPDWYTKDEDGNMVPPVPDWSDVVDFNYDNRELWDYMIEAMKFWVRDVDVDGFRCDVAGMVPPEFWDRVRAELDAIKPVFMLAEAESPDLHTKAFDMTYAWKSFGLLNRMAESPGMVSSLDTHLKQDANAYPPDAYRMRFTTNHDENSWNGTVWERLDGGVKTFAVLTMTLPGMPLVYSGQEAGLDHRLEFFEKDLIPWRDHELEDLYSTLLNLKKENQALWNGVQGGRLLRIRTSHDRFVFAFVREKEDDGVFVLLNLSPREWVVTLE